MIFKSIEETFTYIQSLIDKDISIYQTHLEKICKLNGVEIKKQIYSLGESYEPKLKSIELKDDCFNVVYEKKSWLRHIPSFYHENDFLRRFIAGVEQSHYQVEKQISNISEQFSPQSTEFIDWLSSWLGISISKEVDDLAKRKLVSDMVRLYSIRGTKRYFIDIIRHLTDVIVRIKNTHEYKILHHNLLIKNNKKHLIKVFIDNKISENKDIEDKKLYFIAKILEHEKPIGTDFKIIYKFKDEPIDQQSFDSAKFNLKSKNLKQSLEPVTQKIEELKEEVSRNSEITNEIKKEKIEDKEVKNKKEIKEQKKIESEVKKSSDEKLFEIDNEQDDYYSYDDLE